jgi:vacuolar-type H+-ATPase subunit H
MDKSIQEANAVALKIINEARKKAGQLLS